MGRVFVVWRGLRICSGPSSATWSPLISPRLRLECVVCYLLDLIHTVLAVVGLLGCPEAEHFFQSNVSPLPPDRHHLSHCPSPIWNQRQLPTERPSGERINRVGLPEQYYSYPRVLSQNIYLFLSTQVVLFSLLQPTRQFSCVSRLKAA